MYSPPVPNPFLIWQLMDVTKVNWQAVGESIPTIVALTLFSLMHVPINIPSLSMSTQKSVDMNNELMAHGWSNIVSGMHVLVYVYLCMCLYIFVCV